MTPETNDDNAFSQETIEALTNLGVILNTIRKRMRAEGYAITNGEVRNIETGELWVPPKERKDY